MTSYIVGIALGSLIIVAAIILLIIVLFKRKSSEKLVKEIGRTSEELINKDISSWAKITKNRFINSALFKYNENMFFEVDSILITDKAIIVIEIKSIKGVVKGDARADTWTKILGDQQFPITNPIKQNDKHISHIEKMTNMKVPTISLIVYSNRTSHVDVNNIPSYAGVIRHSELFETLDGVNKVLKPRLNEDEMKMIEKSIRKYEATSSADKKRFQEIIKGGK